MSAKMADYISREIIYGVASGIVNVHDLRMLIKDKMPGESQKTCNDSIEAEIRLGRLSREGDKLSLTQAGIDKLFNLVDIR